MSGQTITGGYETWSKEDRLRSLLAAVTRERDAAVEQAKVAAAQLALVDRYGQYMRNAPTARTFAEWLEWRKQQIAGAVPGAGDAYLPDADDWVHRQSSGNTPPR